MNMLRLMLVPFLLLMVVLSACSRENASANTSASVNSMVSSVPENVVFLGSMKLDAILNDPDLKNTLGEWVKSQDEETGADIEAFLSGEDYGIDPKSINSIVFFGAGNAIPDSDDEDKKDRDAGALVSATYDKERFVAALNKQSDSPMTAQPYKEVDVRASADGENAIGFLAEDLIVIGNVKMVHAVIDVRRGDAKALSGALPSKFESLGSPMIKVAAIPTPESLSSIGDPSGSALPINTDFLTQMTGMAMTMDKSGDTLDFALSLDYPTSDLARRASDDIGGLISLFRGGSTDGNGVLESIDVTASGNTTNITGKLKPAGLKSLNESLPD